MRKKMYMVAAVGLIFLSLSGLGAGWTLAWLTARTQTIKNVFTVGSVQLQLKETFNTDTDGDEKPEQWTGILVPGTILSKDPCVTVPADCEDSWIFVELTETDWPSLTEADGSGRKVTYVVEDGWQPVPLEKNVFFRETKRTEVEKQYPVLKENQVTVSADLTKDEMKIFSHPKLTVTAYAVQQAGFDTAEAAWKEIRPTA